MGGPVTMHPDAVIPDEVLHASHVALLSALARHEPDALERVGRMLEDEGRELASERAGGTAVKLARSWLASRGTAEASRQHPPNAVFRSRTQPR